MKIELTKENYGLNDSSASWDQDQRGDVSSPHDGCHNLHVFFFFSCEEDFLIESSLTQGYAQVIAGTSQIPFHPSE